MFIDNKLYLDWLVNFYVSSVLFKILSIILNIFKNILLLYIVYVYFLKNKFNKLMNDCVVMI